MLSLARTGKVLIFAAGLVAVLDVVGQKRVGEWADSAGKRHAEAAALRDSLNHVWPHLVAAARLAKESARRRSSPDAATVDLRARAEMRERRTPPNLIDDLAYSFPLRERHAQRLITSRLPPGEAGPLNTYLETLRPHWRLVGSIQLAAVPTAAWAFWGEPVMALAAWWAMAFAGFALEVALVSPRVMLRVRLARATAAHRLASAARRMLAHEGRPLRGVALGLFVVGSLLDLVAG